MQGRCLGEAHGPMGAGRAASPRAWLRPQEGHPRWGAPAPTLVPCAHLWDGYLFPDPCGAQATTRAHSCSWRERSCRLQVCAPVPARTTASTTTPGQPRSSPCRVAPDGCEPQTRDVGDRRKLSQMCTVCKRLGARLGSSGTPPAPLSFVGVHRIASAPESHVCDPLS